MITRITLSIVLFIFIYFAGAWSGRNNMFPWPQAAMLKEQFTGAKVVEESRYMFAGNGRLIADDTKTAVPCPAQTERTAVLLVLGQSNAANHSGQRYRSQYGAEVTNFFDGQCFIAASPLLGSTDTRGEYWTLLGNLLIESGKFNSVVIAPLAFSGSEVERWARGGDINGLVIETAKLLRDARYRVTDVLWVQGESDYVKGTSAEAYRERFLSMVDTLRQEGVNAPLYVSVASKCLEPSNGGFKNHEPNNAIVRAQQDLSRGGSGLRAGVNTDMLLDEVDRYDDCHFGGSGGEKAARAWVDLLVADRLKTSAQ